MEASSIYLKYEKLLNLLKGIICASEQRVLCDDPDKLFSENLNFFVKSYIINICTYLEAYLQDICFENIKDINARLGGSGIPHNFLYWQISKDIKDKDLKFSNACYPLTKKQVAEEISGNPYKTIKAFRLIGIDLEKEPTFVRHKDLVNSVVVKRNNIIHHNDNAIDISFSDLLSYIDTIIDYMKCIDGLAGNSGHA